MFVGKISLNREGYYGIQYGSKPDPTKPFRCTVEVHGAHGTLELNLPPDVSERLVAVIADEIVAATRATAEAMVVNVLEAQAVPAIEDKPTE